MSTQLPYKRILLKLSGEMLMEGQPFGVNPIACQILAKSIKALHDKNLEIGIVIGGGNIFRGNNLEAIGIERSPADVMGMLATLINGTVLEEALKSVGCPAILLSALDCPKVAESYTWRSATQALNDGKVAIFVGGTGNPYFTTDTAAALRASEIKADVLLKATKVDGVYSKDPLKHPDAFKYTTMNYSQILADKLEFMDATAVALCRSNNIPILVFNMHILRDHPEDIIMKKHHGTFISGD